MKTPSLALILTVAVVTGAYLLHKQARPFVLSSAEKQSLHDDVNDGSLPFNPQPTLSAGPDASAKGGAAATASSPAEAFSKQCTTLSDANHNPAKTISVLDGFQIVATDQQIQLVQDDICINGDERITVTGGMKEIKDAGDDLVVNTGWGSYRLHKNVLSHDQIKALSNDPGTISDVIIQKVAWGYLQYSFKDMPERVEVYLGPKEDVGDLVDHALKTFDVQLNAADRAKAVDQFRSQITADSRTVVFWVDKGALSNVYTPKVLTTIGWTTETGTSNPENNGSDSFGRTY